MNGKRILLIRTSSLGDVIFNIPLANRLKECGYNLTWLIGERGLDVVKDNPAIDNYIFVPVQKWQKQNFFKTIIEYIKLIKYIRKQKFDIALDTHGMLFKSGIFLLFCGAKRRIIAEDAREFSSLCGNEIIKKSFFNNEKNAVKKALMYADYLKIEPTDLKFSLPETTEETRYKVDKLLENLDKTKPLVVISPATTWIGKHWNKDNWKNLVERIKNKYSLVFTGGKADNELIEYIIDDSSFINLAGKTTILELLEVFKRAELVISLDSGSTHLARATEKPKIISIFCCTPTEFYAPIGDKDKYITINSKNCIPCHKRKCKLREGKYKCTYSPSVDEVLDVINNLMKKDK